MARYPTLFISHGAPDFVISDSPAIPALQSIGRQFPAPRAILVISAHWIEYPVGVTSGVSPATIHDFSGFDPSLYQLRYPAPGAPELAEEIVQQLRTAGQDAHCDPHRGFDHGAWIPLMLSHPNANIPVLQVSLPSPSNLLACSQLGEALAPLRDEDLLIIGSGGSVHNLYALDREGVTADWAGGFENWLQQTLQNGDLDRLNDPAAYTPLFRQAHPTVEHYAPLLTARSAAGGNPTCKRLHSSFSYGNIGMSMYAFD